MTRLLVGILCVFAAIAVAQDSSRFYQKTGVLSTSPDASVPLVTVATVVKVSCIQDAYVTTGPAGVSCLLPDGGTPCDLVRFSLGEKHYVKPMSTHTAVTAMMLDGGVQNCSVFESRN